MERLVLELLAFLISWLLSALVCSLAAVKNIVVCLLFREVARDVESIVGVSVKSVHSGSGKLSVAVECLIITLFSAVVNHQ